MLVLTSFAWAGDYEDSVFAYNRGDFAAALSKGRNAASSGNADAQFLVGLMFDNGQGVVQDYREATYWYKLSASQGHSKAQHNIARLFYLGRANQKSYTLAYYWFTIAAANGGTNESINAVETVGQAMTITGQELVKSKARVCQAQAFKGCENLLRWSEE